MSLFIDREDNITILYPEIYEAWVKIVDQPWSFNEVAMEADIAQWTSMPSLDQSLILSILKGFTKAESGVGCFWSILSSHLKAQEAVNFCRAASYQETVHLRAYAHSESTLGINTTEAYLKDLIAVAKIDHIFDCIDENPDKVAKSLAIFSGAVEGVSLFASFIILLSFAKDGLLLGLKQIISWSVLDEHNHSETGIKLYHMLIEEKPHLKPNQSEIHEAFRIIVENEIAFVENAFEGYSSDRITKEQSVNYIKHRANNRLLALGFAPIYEVDSNLVSEVSWFDQMVFGVSHNDFFASSKNGQGYQAVLTQDFTKVDTTKFQRPQRLIDKFVNVA